jgi:hypothetical protein
MHTSSQSSAGAGRSCEHYQGLYRQKRQSMALRTDMLCSRRCHAGAFTDARPAQCGVSSRARSCAAHCSAPREAASSQVWHFHPSILADVFGCAVSYLRPANDFLPGSSTCLLTLTRLTQLRCGPQESSWGEVLRRCALSLAAVATVSAPILALPQEVGPEPRVSVCMCAREWVRELIACIP